MALEIATQQMINVKKSKIIRIISTPITFHRLSIDHLEY